MLVVSASALSDTFGPREKNYYSEFSRDNMGYDEVEQDTTESVLAEVRVCYCCIGNSDSALFT